jgi:surface carbohydrate biosynthesis protein
MAEKSIVLLVDNRQRDLLATTLIARHLKELGVVCHLEPLESYQGALAAWRPHMMIFNHLTASHLAKYSKRLHEMGVLTTVLTNEGITYDAELLKFIVGSHHSNAHIDLFLCWNREMKKAMEELNAFPMARKEVVGIPRFDFYRRPWAKLFEEKKRPAGSRPRVLVCTNFAFADYRDIPEAAEVFFAALKDRLPVFRDYRALIEVHYQNRLKVTAYLNELTRARKWDVIMRPHPYEKIDFYKAWYDQLPADQKEFVRLDKESNITGLILNTDLQVSCETCTTAMEGWIAEKPSIELTFAKHPVFFHEEHARQQPLCDQPAELVSLVETALKNPAQPEYAAGRRAHLEKWCHTPDGNSSRIVAEKIAAALRDHPEPDWSKLTATDRRRSVKLKLTRTIGEAYHFDPTLPLKHWLAPKKYAVKHFTYQKSIRPGDVKETQERLESSLLSTND